MPSPLPTLRTALGDPVLTGHSGCEGGPYLTLRYETVAEAMRARDALAAVLAGRVVSMVRRRSAGRADG